MCHFAIVHIRKNRFKPLLRVVELNKDLYLHSKQLKDVLALRKNLRHYKEFVYSCRSKEMLLDLLQSRAYMLEDDIHAYSMHDLVHQHLKKLIPWMLDVISKLKVHIMSECQSCRGKGNYCEICDSEAEIFPFQSRTEKCPRCGALYHKTCYTPYKVKCPKCIRASAIKSKHT